MAWISVHESVDGPKLRNLYKSLRCSKFEALGILNFLWLWGLTNAEKNGLVKYADRGDIERYLYGVGAGCRIDAAAIVSALVDSGWIDEVPEGIFLHDWEEWQEQWYKAKERREKDAKRKAEKRSAAAAGEPVQTTLSLDSGEVKAEEPAPDPPKKKASRYEPEFDEFWRHYPRKADKGAAYKKYMTRRKEGYSAEELLTACKNYAMECVRRNTAEEYIKHPKTFLSDTRPFLEFIPKTTVMQDEESGGNPFAEYEER